MQVRFLANDEHVQLYDFYNKNHNDAISFPTTVGADSLREFLDKLDASLKGVPEHLKDGDYEVVLKICNDLLDELAIRSDALKSHSQSEDEPISVTSDVGSILQFATKQVYIQRAWAYLALRQFDDAINDFMMVTTFDAKDARPFLSLGYAYLQNKDYEAAIASLSFAIELDNESSLAYYYRSQCYKYLQQNQQAILDLICALNLADIINKEIIIKIIQELNCYNSKTIYEAILSLPQDQQKDILLACQNPNSESRFGRYFNDRKKSDAKLNRDIDDLIKTMHQQEAGHVSSISMFNSNNKCNIARKINEDRQRVQMTKHLHGLI